MLKKIQMKQTESYRWNNAPSNSQHMECPSRSSWHARWIGVSITTTDIEVLMIYHHHFHPKVCPDGDNQQTSVFKNWTTKCLEISVLWQMQNCQYILHSYMMVIIGSKLHDDAQWQNATCLCSSIILVLLSIAGN